MVSKIKQRQIHANPVVGGARAIAGLNPTANTGATLENLAGQLKRARFKLVNFSVTVLAANDYGGTKLCDLPNTNMMIVGAIVDLDAAVTGTGSALANVDLAVGTVVTASAAFSNAGEKDIVPKIDCTAGGVIDGANSSTEQNKFIAAGSSNALFVNVATGNITTDGAVTLNGFIDILYIDVGKAT